MTGRSVSGPRRVPRSLRGLQPPQALRWIATLIAAALLCVSCQGSDRSPPSVTTSRPTPQRSSQGPEPYPYTKPVPPRAPTAIDGTYRRTLSVRLTGGFVPCRRCAPYRLEAGRSTLVLDEGRFVLEHKPAAPESAGFSATGHFTIAEREVALFNDPSCTHVKGVYGWTLGGGELTFASHHDPCFVGLRMEYLTARSWTSISHG